MAQPVWTQDLERPFEPTRVAARLYGRARAVVRLLAFMLVTFYWMGRYAARASWTGTSRHLAARYAQRWSASLNDALGLRIRTVGTAPDGPALLVCNHRSYIDITAVGGQLPCTFLAKSDMINWPVLGWAAGLSNTIFVTRESRESRKHSLTEIFSTIEQGTPVVVFPEGTTSAGPDLLPYRPGSFVLAAQHDIPVVPLAIHYRDVADAWIGDDTFIAHFLRRFAEPERLVTVAFGPPLRGSDGEALCAQARNWALRAIKDISERETPCV